MSFPSRKLKASVLLTRHMVGQDMGLFRTSVPIVDADYAVESGRPPAEAIIEDIAAAADIDPMDLPPLYQFVELEAIDELFQNHGQKKETNALFCFQMDQWNVFISSDGKIRVCDATEHVEPEPIFENHSA